MPAVRSHNQDPLHIGSVVQHVVAFNCKNWRSDFKAVCRIVDEIQQRIARFEQGSGLKTD